RTSESAAPSKARAKSAFIRARSSSDGATNLLGSAPPVRASTIARGHTIDSSRTGVLGADVEGGGGVGAPVPLELERHDSAAAATSKTAAVVGFIPRNPPRSIVAQGLVSRPHGAREPMACERRAPCRRARRTRACAGPARGRLQE